MFKKASAILPLLLTLVFIVALLIIFGYRQRNATPSFQENRYSIGMYEGKININTASAPVLRQLPGIGEKMALRIVQYREDNGDFRSIEELVNVNGFTEEMLEQIAMYITTGDVK